jgi:hypothetical protein
MTISESAGISPAGLVGASLHAANATSAVREMKDSFFMALLLRHKGCRRDAASGALLR